MRLECTKWPTAFAPNWRGREWNAPERLKNCRFTIHGTRGFKEAMVTAGGVKLSEVNPNTLESKLLPNLFLAGEVLDLTGPSGGYNLQLAFSTGHLAGTAIAQRLLP